MPAVEAGGDLRQADRQRIVAGGAQVERPEAVVLAQLLERLKLKMRRWLSSRLGIALPRSGSKRLPITTSDDTLQGGGCMPSTSEMTLCQLARLLVDMTTRPFGLTTRRISRRKPSVKCRCSMSWLAWTMSKAPSS